MNWRIAALTMVLGAFLATGCSDDDIPKTNMALGLSMPAGLNDVSGLSVKDGSVTFTNRSNGLTTIQAITSLNTTEVNLLDGAYDVLVEAVINYTVTVQESEVVEGKLVTKDVTKVVEKSIRGFKENVMATNGTANLKLDTFLFNEDAGFVISEIFYAGCKTSETAKLYTQATYIEIYNNSNETLYADGLAIGETTFRTDFSKFKKDLSPDDRNTHVAIDAIYQIPGNGKTHPVEPGKSIVLCDVAIDHSAKYEGAPDLSKSKFEWYDVSSISRIQDVDVAEVTNLDKVYCYTKTVWKLKPSGISGYVLFKLGKEKQDFIDNNKQVYDFTFAANGRESNKSTYRIPNENVIDAVELSNSNKFYWKIMSPELDLSWTNCGEGDKGYNQSIARKVSHQSALGHPVLLDTNNSAYDFKINETPNPGQVN